MFQDNSQDNDQSRAQGHRLKQDNTIGKDVNYICYQLLLGQQRSSRINRRYSKMQEYSLNQQEQLDRQEEFLKPPQSQAKLDDMNDYVTNQMDCLGLCLQSLQRQDEDTCPQYSSISNARDNGINDICQNSSAQNVGDFLLQQIHIKRKQSQFSNEGKEEVISYLYKIFNLVQIILSNHFLKQVTIGQKQTTSLQNFSPTYFQKLSYSISQVTKQPNNQTQITKFINAFCLFQSPQLGLEAIEIRRQLTDTYTLYLQDLKNRSKETGSQFYSLQEHLQSLRHAHSYLQTTLNKSIVIEKSKWKLQYICNQLKDMCLDFLKTNERCGAISLTGRPCVLALHSQEQEHKSGLQLIYSSYNGDFNIQQNDQFDEYQINHVLSMETLEKDKNKNLMIPQNQICQPILNPHLVQSLDVVVYSMTQDVGALKIFNYAQFLQYEVLEDKHFMEGQRSNNKTIILKPYLCVLAQQAQLVSLGSNKMYNERKGFEHQGQIISKANTLLPLKLKIQIIDNLQSQSKAVASSQKQAQAQLVKQILLPQVSKQGQQQAPKQLLQLQQKQQQQAQPQQPQLQRSGRQAQQISQQQKLILDNSQFPPLQSNPNLGTQQNLSSFKNVVQNQGMNRQQQQQQSQINIDGKQSANQELNQNNQNQIQKQNSKKAISPRDCEQANTNPNTNTSNNNNYINSSKNINNSIITTSNSTIQKGITSTKQSSTKTSGSNNPSSVNNTKANASVGLPIVQSTEAKPRALIQVIRNSDSSKKNIDNKTLQTDNILSNTQNIDNNLDVNNFDISISSNLKSTDNKGKASSRNVQNTASTNDDQPQIAEEKAYVDQDAQADSNDTLDVKNKVLEQEPEYGSKKDFKIDVVDWPLEGMQQQQIQEVEQETFTSNQSDKGSSRDVRSRRGTSSGTQRAAQIKINKISQTVFFGFEYCNLVGQKYFLQPSIENQSDKDKTLFTQQAVRQLFTQDLDLFTYDTSKQTPHPNKELTELLSQDKQLPNQLPLKMFQLQRIFVVTPDLLQLASRPVIQVLKKNSQGESQIQFEIIVSQEMILPTNRLCVINLPYHYVALQQKCENEASKLESLYPTPDNDLIFKLKRGSYMYPCG